MQELSCRRGFWKFILVYTQDELGVVHQSQPKTPAPPDVRWKGQINLNEVMVGLPGALLTLLQDLPITVIRTDFVGASRYHLRES